MYSAGENGTIKRSKFNLKSMCRSRHEHFSVADGTVVDFVLEKCKNGLPVIRETLQALEIATSLKMPQQDLKASNGWAIRIMHHKGLAHRWRTTLSQKLPTDC
jgi:hypothetical protein